MAKKDGILVDEKKQAYLRKQVNLERVQHNADLQWMLEDPRGRRLWYWLIFEKCGVMDGIWTPSAEIHKREGRREVGIELVAETQQEFPHSYTQMIEEKMRENAARKAARDAIVNEEKDDE